MLIKFTIIFFIELLILSSIPIQACSTPVYQYALENWSADPYEVFVFYNKRLSADDQYKVDKLAKSSEDDRFRSNIIVKMIDLSDSSNIDFQKFLESQKKSAPYTIIKYPGLSRIPENVWEGKINDLNIENIISSPARKEIIKRIINREVAVWVFLESGNKQKDNIAFNTLETQLKKMSETLKIINIHPLQTEEIKKDAKFSLIKLSRSDQKENFFANILLKSEPDLKSLPEPMAFPIFGRGRVLYSLVGDGINADNIESACSFLIGWCSCEIKDMNPGVDILMSMDWDKAIKGKLEETEDNEEKAESITNNNPNKLVMKEKSDIGMLKPQISSNKINRNELSKQIQKINSDSGDISLIATKDEPSYLKRNILIAVSVIILGIAIATGFILLKRRQNE